MPARIQSTLMPGKNPGLPLFIGLFLAVLLFARRIHSHKLPMHSPGWSFASRRVPHAPRPA